jgi:gluconolactonase
MDKESVVAVPSESADSPYELLDDRFRACQGDKRLQRLTSEGRWLEGPAYFPTGRYLVCSDVPNDRILRWDEASGQTGVFRRNTNYANGNTVDRDGRLVTCEQGARRVTRTEHDGTITVIADRHEGKRLNSPNDVVVHSDGSIWFTDSTYGIDSDYQGYRAKSEIGAQYVYRVDPVSGSTQVVATDFVQPNGLAFSKDEQLLYIADTGISHVPNGPRHIRVFRVGSNGKLSGGEIFATCTVGAFDGFRLDSDGRVWASAFDGVHCYDPDGTLLGKIRVPQIVANVCFGGPRRSILYICASTSLYSLMLSVTGNK